MVYTGEVQNLLEWNGYAGMKQFLWDIFWVHILQVSTGDMYRKLTLQNDHEGEWHQIESNFNTIASKLVRQMWAYLLLYFFLV